MFAVKMRGVVDYPCFYKSRCTLQLERVYVAVNPIRFDNSSRKSRCVSTPITKPKNRMCMESFVVDVQRNHGDKRPGRLTLVPMKPTGPGARDA